MKLRWVDPDFWNDNFTETGRSYKVLCEIEDENTGHTRTFLALTMDAAFNGYDEKYIFPQGPFVARCRIKAKNGAALESKWALSPSVKIYELFSAPLEPIPEEPSKNLTSTEFISGLKHHHRNKFWTKYRSA
ncbi:hypothetical protein FO519_003340 [Halicephalobus sp. NKZ332]|nr:hypothetical protein FO519_003340 [Halicephalobus sp. NKZ332]